MEKIRNIYCWNHLRDWMEAQNTGMVYIVEAKQHEEGLFRWEQLIRMIYEDCFPQSFLCFRKGKENYLVLTKEQKRIFKFLQNEIMLQKEEGTQYLFSDYPTEFRNRILNARVDSIWIRLDEEQCTCSSFLQHSS